MIEGKGNGNENGGQERNEKKETKIRDSKCREEQILDKTSNVAHTLNSEAQGPVPT
jgi:hypothetical protein